MDFLRAELLVELRMTEAGVGAVLGGPDGLTAILCFAGSEASVDNLGVMRATFGGGSADDVEA